MRQVFTQDQLSKFDLAAKKFRHGAKPSGKGAQENMFRKLIALIAAPARAGGAAVPRVLMPDTAFNPISLAQALRLAHDNNVPNITSDNAIRTANNSLRGARAVVSEPHPHRGTEH